MNDEHAARCQAVLDAAQSRDIEGYGELVDPSQCKRFGWLNRRALQFRKRPWATWELNEVHTHAHNADAVDCLVSLRRGTRLRKRLWRWRRDRESWRLVADLALVAAPT